MESPYTPPTSVEHDAVSLARSKKTLGWAAFVCGLGVVIPPLIGLIGVVKGMMGSFSALEQTGSADPSALAGEISVVLLSAFWSLIFSALLLIPFLVFLVLYFKRRKILRSFVASQTAREAPRDHH